MNVNELIPHVDQKLIFSRDRLLFVPKGCGCYVLTTYDDAILYIGLSKNLYQRFSQHLDNPHKINPTKEGKPFWFHYKLTAQHELLTVERTWLNKYQAFQGALPVLNKINSPLT